MINLMKQSARQENIIAVTAALEKRDCSVQHISGKEQVILTGAIGRIL